MSDRDFSLELVQLTDYRFEVHFDDATLPALVTDEPPPLGAGSGPDPSQLLVAAVANCLCASLQFALRKFGSRPEPMRARAALTTGRNPQGRLRVARIEVELHLGAAAAELQRLERALAQFEDFCVVTQSVRAGIDVQARVFDRNGARLDLPQGPARDAS